MHDYEGVRFIKDMRCPACRTLLARRFSTSFAFHENGAPVENFGIGGLSYDEMQAVYVIPCECGGRLEFSTPDQADQFMLTSEARATGPNVFKLT